MPRLSVIMAARNAAETIETAIKSTLLALPKDSEILVWNDASDDGTDRVLDRLSDSVGGRLKVASADRSVGSGIGRQRLLDLSDSDYVANMDADDVCLPWRFGGLATHALKSADVIFTPIVRFQHARVPRLSNMPAMNANDARIALLVNNPMPHPTMIGRRSSLYAAGGYRDVRWGQDYELFLRLVATGHSLSRATIASVLYRQSSTQATVNPNYSSYIVNNSDVRSSYLRLFEESGGRMRNRPTDQIEKLMSTMSKYWRRRYAALLSGGSPTEPLGVQIAQSLWGAV